MSSEPPSNQSLESSPQTQYDIAVHSMLLPGNINKDLVINFLNEHHRTVSGTTTLITEENYQAISKVGTVCSYIMKGELIGVIFNTLATITIISGPPDNSESKASESQKFPTTIRSSYSTYMCVAKQHRKKNYAHFLVDASDKFQIKTLKTYHSYFLSYKDWGGGLPIRTFYRVIDYQNMKKGGFGVLKKKAKIFYHIRKTIGYIITPGIDIDITERDFDIYWNPVESEKKRFSEMFNFKTVKFKHQTMVFSLFPLKCLVNKTSQTVSIGMLSYFYITDPEMKDSFLKIVIQEAEKEGYDCVYGYTLGDIDTKLVEENSCHITAIQYYLNFYGNSRFEFAKNLNLDLKKINLLFY